MSAIPSDYPENDNDWGEENECEWKAVADIVDNELIRVSQDRSAFEVSATRFNAFSVDVGLLKLGSLPPALVYPAAQSVRKRLRSIAGYWRVRIWIMDETNTALWLEVDKHGVYLSLGRVEQSLFSTLPEFYKHYWGTDYGVIV